MVKGGRQSTCVAEQLSRELRGNNVPAGTLALVRSPLALRCSREQNALHTLIRHRHLTPSCGGRVPTAERTLDPARMFMESLTTGPELENSQGHFSTEAANSAARPTSPSPRKMTSGPHENLVAMGQFQTSRPTFQTRPRVRCDR